MKKYALINNTHDQKNENQSQLVFIINSQSIKRGLKFIFAFVILYLLFLISPYIKSLLFSLGISFVLSFLLSPLVDSLENHGLNRTAAVILIFLIIITAIVLGLQFLIPSISQEVKSISEFIQNENAESIIKKLQVILADRFPALQKPEVAEKVSTKLHNILTVLIEKSSNIIRSVLSSFMLIITIPFITFFFLKDGRRIKKYIIQLVPNRYFEMSLNLIHKSNQKLGAYIRGQLMVSFVIGSLSVLALFLLNIPYFFIIGILAGLANMIPYFGPLVGATPGVIIAFIETGSTGTMVGVIVAFALIQLIDNVLVSPLIVSKSVNIHPLLVILVLLLGSSIAGILGMLIAIPVFAVIQVIIKEILWSFRNYRLTG